MRLSLISLSSVSCFLHPARHPLPLPICVASLSPSPVTAIINHGKEHSLSGLKKTVMGRLPACLPASLAQLHGRIKQRFNTGPRTARSKEQGQAVRAAFLRPLSAIFCDTPNWTAWYTACCYVRPLIRTTPVKLKSNPGTGPTRSKSRRGQDRQ